MAPRPGSVHTTAIRTDDPPNGFLAPRPVTFFAARGPVLLAQDTFDPSGVGTRIRRRPASRNGSSRRASRRDLLRCHPRLWPCTMRLGRTPGADVGRSHPDPLQRTRGIEEPFPSRGIKPLRDDSDEPPRDPKRLLGVGDRDCDALAKNKSPSGEPLQVFRVHYAVVVSEEMADPVEDDETVPVN